MLVAGGYMKSVLKVMKLMPMAKTDFVRIASIFLFNLICMVIIVLFGQLLQRVDALFLHVFSTVL